MYFMYRLHLPHLEMGLPDELRGEKEASKSASMRVMWETKNWNLDLGVIG